MRPQIIILMLALHPALAAPTNKQWSPGSINHASDAWREFPYKAMKSEPMSAMHKAHVHGLVDSVALREAHTRLVKNGGGGLVITAFQTRHAGSISKVFRRNSPEWIFVTLPASWHKSLGHNKNNARAMEVGSTLMSALECDAARLRTVGALQPSAHGARSIAVDIGAQWGDSMMPLAMVADHTVVFEPNPLYYSTVHLTAKLNPDLGLHTVNAGIGKDGLGLSRKGLKGEAFEIKIVNFEEAMISTLGQSAMQDIRYVKTDTDASQILTTQHVHSAFSSDNGAGAKYDPPAWIQVENGAMTGSPKGKSDVNELFQAIWELQAPEYDVFCTRQISNRGPHNARECVAWDSLTLPLPTTHPTLEKGVHCRDLFLKPKFVDNYVEEFADFQ